MVLSKLYDTKKFHIDHRPDIKGLFLVRLKTKNIKYI